MSRRTVAIVLSNYNHGRYLPESLGAICSQTRPADEIIVVDDGSTDDSAAVIEDAALRHRGIRFLRNPRNLGLQASISRALPEIQSDYLAWAASDDRLLPQFLEKSMAALERHPNAGLCFSELTVLKADTGELERFAVIPGVEHIFDLSDLPECLDPSALLRRMRRASLHMTSNSVVVRRDALLGMGGYPAQLEWYADSFAYTVIALRHGACVVPETLALIRANPASYSQRGMEDPVRQRRVLVALLDLLAMPTYRDIRRMFRVAPSNLSHYGPLMPRLQLRRVRDWDLLLAALVWRLGYHKRIHQLSGLEMTGRMALRLARLAMRPLARQLRRRMRTSRGAPDRSSY